MHWDYWVYREQPWQFILEIWEHLKAESDAAEANERIARAKSRNK